MVIPQFGLSQSSTQGQENTADLAFAVKDALGKVVVGKVRLDKSGPRPAGQILQPRVHVLQVGEPGLHVGTLGLLEVQASMDEVDNLLNPRGA